MTKIVEVFRITQSTLLAMYETRYVTSMINNWFKTDEGLFVINHTIEPVKIVKEHCNSAPLIDEVVISLFAVFDEEIETFWRLKFK